jgi:hypothetical protein
MARAGETSSISVQHASTEIGVRTVITGVLGLIAGFVASIVPSDRGSGMDLLPIAPAIARAFAAPVADVLTRRWPRRL